MARRTADHANPLHAAALGVLARGWSVIPVEPRGKRPIVAWTKFQSRQATPQEVERWFRAARTPNLGVVTGAVSNLVVIDVDVQHGGSQSLARLELEHGNLPDTVEARTGGGGRHLYFSHPGGVVHNRVGLAPGLDVRGDGGCIVAPPSVHPSGQRYAWIPGHAPDEIALATLPAWLLHLARPPAARPGHPLSHWRKLTREGVAEGSRNDTLASLAGHLLRQGVDPEVVLELLLAWNRVRCRPPLPDAEVAQVVESISRLHRQGGER